MSLWLVSALGVALAGSLPMAGEGRARSDCEKGVAGACHDLARAAEWSWAHHHARAVRTNAAPFPARFAQAMALHHRACDLGDERSCATLDRLVAASADATGSCEKGWASSCERLTTQERAPLCLAGGPDHPACGALTPVATLDGVQAVFSWGVVTEAGLFTGTEETRWSTGVPIGAVAGAFFYGSGVDAVAPVHSLSPAGLTVAHEGLELGKDRRMVTDGDGRAHALFVRYDREAGGPRASLIAIDDGTVTPLEGIPVDAAAGRVVVGQPAEGETPEDASQWWVQDWAGERLLATGGGDPKLSPDGRLLAVARGDNAFAVPVDDGPLIELGPGRPVAWAPDGAWIALRGDDQLRLVAADGRELVRVDGAPTDIVAGPGLIWLDGMLYEVAPGAWDPQPPPRDEPAPLPPAMQAWSSPSVYGARSFLEMQVRDCAGDPAETSLVRTDWAAHVDGSVALPASVTKNHRLELLAYTPEGARPQPYRITPEHWWGERRATLWYQCELAPDDDVRSRMAWRTRVLERDESWTDWALLPRATAVSTPAKLTADVDFLPALARDAEGWWSTTVQSKGKGAEFAHERLPEREVVVLDAKGEPIAGAVARIRLGALGETWASAGLDGVLVVPTGAMLDFGAGEARAAASVTLGASAKLDRVPDTALPLPAGTWKRLRADRLDEPDSPDLLTSDALSGFAPLVLDEDTVVAHVAGGAVVYMRQR